MRLPFMYLQTKKLITHTEVELTGICSGGFQRLIAYGNPCSQE